MANLANFAYDPNNMEYLRELQVTDLFLDMLTEENDNFVEFGMGEHPINKTAAGETASLDCGTSLITCHVLRGAL